LLDSLLQEIFRFKLKAHNYIPLFTGSLFSKIAGVFVENRMGSTRPREDEEEMAPDSPSEAQPPAKVMRTEDVTQVKEAPFFHSDHKVNGDSYGQVNGESNGLVNGHSNGLVNGHSNGLVNGDSNGHTEASNGLVNGDSNGHIENNDEKSNFVPTTPSILFPSPPTLNGETVEKPEANEDLSEAEREAIQKAKDEEEEKRLDELNADKWKCGLCKRPRYFEFLYQLHDHLLEFHLVLNDEEEVNKHVIPPIRPPPTPEYPSTKDLLGEIVPEPQDPLIFEPQTFRPTYEEFKDLQGYIKYMESCGAHKAGIAKIVVPREWVPRKQGYNPSDFDITIPGPVQQNISCTEVDGAFKTIADRSIPPITIEKYMKLATGKKYLTPAHNSYEELEQLYWKENNDETKLAPIYGADVEQSITDPEVDVWNIKKLDSILTDVLDEQIPGVNTPYLYVGMWKATFSWHVEDMDLYAVNFIHYGAPKTWYGIPPSEGHKLEQLAQKMFPDMAKTCFNLMRHKAIMISPKLLEAHGVRVNKLVQEERNMIIAFPHAYHSGFNHGFNMAESTNFAIDRWVEYGKRFRDCLCRGSEDEVSIDLDPFVQRVQPERYEDYKAKKDWALHPEDPWYVKRCYKDACVRFEQGQITEAEFENMKRHLKRKRQIPFWFKQKFQVDYYDQMDNFNVSFNEDTENQPPVDAELEEKVEEAKYNLVKKLSSKKPILDVKMKGLRKGTVNIYLNEMKTYMEMRDEMYREEEDRKRSVVKGFNNGNAGKALGHGQAKGVGFKNVDENDLIEKRSKVICRAKKNHRFKACTKCTGCKRENCGECTYCLDMPKFGGMGVIKQKCELRLCINPILRTCDQCEWVI